MVWGRANDQSDLLSVCERDIHHLSRIALAIHVNGNRGRGLAIHTDARIAEDDLPLGKELTKSAGDVASRLGVNDSRLVMRVQGRDAGLRAPGDMPVSRGAAPLAALDGRVCDADADAGGDRSAPSIDTAVTAAL